MLTLRPRLSPVFAWLLLPALIAAGSAQSARDRLSSRIEIYGPAGIHVVTSNSSVERDGDRYSVRSNLQSTGLAGLLIDLTSHAESKGRLTVTGAQPESHRSETRRNGTDRRAQLAYGPDGAVTGTATGAPTDVTPIASAQLRGTIDDLTAWFLVERQVGRGGKCDMVVPVFDGHVRYNMRFTDMGEQVLAPRNGQNFAGKAHVCMMRRENVAGFPASSKEDDTVHSGKLWYAKLLPTEQAQAIRFELETDIGSVSGYLAEIRGTAQGRSVELKLME